MAKVKSVTSQPVKYVFSTHHHADHSGGNAKFLPTAEIISTANARANIVEHKQSNAPPGVEPARVEFPKGAIVRFDADDAAARKADVRWWLAPGEKKPHEGLPVK